MKNLNAITIKLGNKIILKNAKHLKSESEMAKGLMFANRTKCKKGVLMELPCEKSRLFASIHMFFVFYPLDIIFLNKNKVIVDIVRVIPFFPFYMPKKPSKYIIESNLKMISKNKLKIGDKLSFKIIINRNINLINK